MKRSVRKRCGFGCVICGDPLITYEHILDWAKVKKHEEHNLTLLCFKHQAESTKKLLSKETIKEKNKNPYNIHKRKSKPHPLNFYGQSFKIRAGETDYVVIGGHNEQTKLSAIVIDGKEILGFKIIDEHILISLILFDKNNVKLLEIKESELLFMLEENLWDLEFIGNHLTLRNAPRKIQIFLRFDIPDTLVIERGIFYYNGIKVEFQKHQVIIGNQQGVLQAKEFGVSNNGVIMNLGDVRRVSSVLSFKHLDRYYWNK